MKQFWIGSGLVAALLGFVLGLASSPVAGAAVAAVVALIGSVLATLAATFSLRGGREAGAEFDTDKAMEAAKKVAPFFGKLGIVLTISLGIGVFGGAMLRLNGPLTTAMIPWSDSTRPISAERAIRWLVLAAQLRAAGYSEVDVKRLFEIDQTVRKRTKDSLELFNDHLLLSGQLPSRFPMMILEPSLKRIPGIM